MQNNKKSSTFRTSVKAHLEAPELLVTTGGKEFRLPWAERYRWLLGLREHDQQATVRIPDRLPAIPVGRAIEILCPWPRLVWSKTEKLGGYQIFFQEELPENTEVWKIDLPAFRQGEDPSLFELAARPFVEAASLAYVQDGLTLVTGCGSWGSFWADKGMEIEPSAAIAKRLKPLTAPRSINWTFQEPLRLKLIGQKDDVLSTLLDGILTIRRRVLKQAWPGCKLSHRRARKRAMRAKLFSGRFLVPAGTPGVEKGATLKGRVCVLSDRAMDRLHGKDVDIVSHVINLKHELRGWSHWTIGLEPEEALDTVRTNVQQMTSVPMLFPPEQVFAWAQEHLKRIVHSIRSGCLLDTFEDLRRLTKDDPQSILYQSRWAAFRFLGQGYDFRHSPGLARNLFEAHSTAMVDVNAGEIKVPVPYAWRMPVLSATAAHQMCGWKANVKPGQIRIHPRCRFAVVADSVWTKDQFLLNHGGCDGDDEFSLYFRRVEGQLKVFVVRDPSDFGEYSLFDYVEGDSCPEERQVMWRQDGSVATHYKPWPTVNMQGAPKPIAEMVAEGMEIGSLPTSTVVVKQYGPEAVLADLGRALHGTNPGAWANSRMLFNLVTRRHAKKLPFLMEDCVDACKKGGCREALIKIRTASRDLLTAIVGTPGVRIDRTFWKSRRFSWTGPVNQVDGWFTRLLQLTDQARKALLGNVKEWAQKIHETPPSLVARFGDTPDWKSEDVKRVRQMIRDMRQEQAIISQIRDRKQKTEEFAELNRQMRELVGDQLPLFAWLLHKVPLASGEISDGMLFSAPFIDAYLQLIGTFSEAR